MKVAWLGRTKKKRLFAFVSGKTVIDIVKVIPLMQTDESRVVMNQDN